MIYFSNICTFWRILSCTFKIFFSLRDHFSFYIETKIIIFQKLINKKSIKNDKAINEIANDYEIIITFFIMFIINNLKNTVK